MIKAYRLLILALVVITMQSISFAQAEDPVWSRPKVSNVNVMVPQETQTVYIPTLSGPKAVTLKGGKAIVYPNFRPLPTTNTTQSEVSVDVHPNNANIILASANASNWPVSTIYGTSLYYSLDGGNIWAGNDNPPFGTNYGDPATAIGVDGKFYIGFIDNGTNDGGQGVAVSSNNGATWQRYVAGPKPPTTSDLLDKNHLTVDRKATSPYVNRLYAAWTNFITGSPSNQQVELRYSSNFGQNWSSAKIISNSTSTPYLGQGVNLQTGPAGQIYGCWTVYDQAITANTNTEDAIGFNKSTDGGDTWGTPLRAYAAPNFGIRGNLTSKGSMRVASFPSMAVDRSGGAYNGNIYISWVQRGVAPAGSDPDVVFIKSTDGGNTFSAPARVNNDPVGNGKDQFMNWMTIDQSTGHVYCTFYDSRNSPNNDSAEVFLARSIDGGQTWENISVSDRKFKPGPITGFSANYGGDYIGVAATNNTVYPFWTENRTGAWNGWMAKVTFGPNLKHTPLKNTENLAGPYKVSLKAESALPLRANKVKVFWGRGTSGQITDSILMTPVTADSFVANIPGNNLAAVYNYYIYAEDTTGGFSTMPAGAPGTKYSFEAKTDNELPVITHTVLPNQYRETWPARVTAKVTDNIGLDSVKVLYRVKSSGTLRSFVLVAGDSSKFSGLFNNDTTTMAVGDTLYYQIYAKDASIARNVAYFPSATTWASFRFIPDTEAPVATHQPLRNQAKIRWPAKVSATAMDNIGIRSVKTEYNIRNGVLTGSFNMNLQPDGTYMGTFPVDTSQVRVGDTVKYRIQVIDISNARNTIYLPASGFYQFAIVNALGVVLVVNDDVMLSARQSPTKGMEGMDVLTPLGASASLIASTLIPAGYVVDTVAFAALDTNLLRNFDIVALAAGAKSTTVFEDLGKRTAIVNYMNAGGKVFVEGGEIGYVYRYSSATSDKDPNFRRAILNDSTWRSDMAGGLIKKIIPGHQLFTTPFVIPDSIALNNPTTPYQSYAARDAMSITPNKPGVFKLGGWYPTMPDTASVIAWSPTGNIASIRTLFYCFSLSHMVNQDIAKNLIVNGFNWLSGSGPNVPVEMTSFNATSNNNEVNLVWSTATELNNRGFAIERKASNEGQFTQVGFVQGSGTTVVPRTYNYKDMPAKEGVYSYRLKQIDLDGKYEYSATVQVDVTLPAIYSLEQNYPNPFNPETSIRYSIPKDGNVTLSIYNVLGERIMVLVNELQKAGSYSFKFSGSSVPSGVYYYKLESGDFSAIRKMVLLK